MPVFIVLMLFVITLVYLIYRKRYEGKTKTISISKATSFKSYIDKLNENDQEYEQFYEIDLEPTGSTCSVAGNRPNRSIISQYFKKNDKENPDLPNKRNTNEDINESYEMLQDNDFYIPFKATENDGRNDKYWEIQEVHSSKENPKPNINADRKSCSNTYCVSSDIEHLDKTKEDNSQNDDLYYEIKEQPVQCSDIYSEPCDTQTDIYEKIKSENVYSEICKSTEDEIIDTEQKGNVEFR